MTRLPLPRLRSGSWARWVGAAVAAVVVVSGALWFAPPEQRLGALLVPLVLALVALEVAQDGYLDTPASGGPALGQRRLGRSVRRVQLTGGTRVNVVGAHGTVHLVAVSPTGERAAVDLLVTTLHTRAGRGPDVLRALADAVGRPEVEDGPRIASLLRAQAEHVAVDGDLESSPLAGRRGPPAPGLRF
ncbi:MAG TPA: hypothetical protein VES95_05780 [Dermatophilaceae bacterium]|nr:hypothetical protein [Dermatophilaceae bacterium]